MRVKKITREKLYKREYERDDILKIDGKNTEPQIFEDLARVVALMIRGGN